MKFGTVPQIAKDARPWAPTRVIGPPPGREGDIGSLECQVDEHNSLNARCFRFFVELEPGDLEAIQAGKPIEFAVFAHQMVPVSVAVWQ